jgi:hypothetical protein
MNILRSSFSPRSNVAVGLWTVVVSLLLCSCNRTPPIITEGAGHAITAEIEGTPLIETQTDSVVVAGPHGRVTIERERVRLDELDWTAIPADVPVTVTIKRHKVRIAAGPVTIERTMSD